MAISFTSNERRIVGLTSVGHSLCHISELAFAAVLFAVMTEFELSPDRATALAVPGFILYGMLAVPAGIWTDRRGSREVLFVYFLLVALSATLVMIAKSSLQLGMALTVLGAAISLYHPAGLAMLSHGCRHRGRAMGINGVAGSFGVSLGPALGLFLAGMGHWRAVYGVIAVCAVVGASLLRWIPTDVEAHLTAPKQARNEPSPNDANRGNRSMRWGVIAWLFAAMTLGGVNYRCLTTALPDFIRDETGKIADGVVSVLSTEIDEPATLDTATLKTASPAPGRSSDVQDPAPGSSKSLLLFFVLALGGAGQLMGGYLADRYRPAFVYALFILLTIPCALTMAHTLAPTTSIAAGILAVFMFAQQPLENMMIAEATPARWRSTVYGLKFVLAFGLASPGAYLVGWIWVNYRLAAVFDVFAAVAVLMAAFALCYAWSSSAKQEGVRP